jgi:hypothetical protein
MNHGSTIAVPAPTNNPDGTVTASFYLSMAGLWQVFFEAQSGGVTDTVSFYFCVS